MLFFNTYVVLNSKIYETFKSTVVILVTLAPDQKPGLEKSRRNKKFLGIFETFKRFLYDETLKHVETYIFRHLYFLFFKTPFANLQLTSKEFVQAELWHALCLF